MELLKIGDKLYYKEHSRWTDNIAYKFATVERLTKTQAILSNSTKLINEPINGQRTKQIKMAKIKIKRKGRNFETGKFIDRYGYECSIQKSSLATEDCIWLGIDDAKPQIMSSDAIRMGLRQRTFDKNDNGWVKFEIPKEVLLSTRMHLTRKQVKELLPLLQKFVETGELS